MEIDFFTKKSEFQTVEPHAQIIRIIFGFFSCFWFTGNQIKAQTDVLSV